MRNLVKVLTKAETHHAKLSPRKTWALKNFALMVTSKLLNFSNLKKSFDGFRLQSELCQHGWHHYLWTTLPPVSCIINKSLTCVPNNDNIQQKSAYFIKLFQILTFLRKPYQTFAAFADSFQKSSKQRAHYFRGGAKNDETARLPASKQMPNIQKVLKMYSKLNNTL